MREFNNSDIYDCFFLRFLWNEEYQILVTFNSRVLEYIISIRYSFAKNFRRMKVISRIGMEVATEKIYRKDEKRKIEERNFSSFFVERSGAKTAANPLILAKRR